MKRVGCEKEFQKLCGMDSTDLRNPTSFRWIFSIVYCLSLKTFSGCCSLHHLIITNSKTQKTTVTHTTNVDNQIIMYQVE